MQSLSIILLIGFWVWCSKQTAKKQLSLNWYMWLVSLVCGGLFGLAVYDYYRRKQKKA